MNGKAEEIMDFASWWSSLNEYFKKIYENVNCLYEQNQNSVVPLTRKEYMEIYSTIYTMSIKKDFRYDQQLYSKFDEIILKYYTEYVLKIFKSKSDELLIEIRKRWNNHQDLLRLLTHLFSYIDRSYVVHHSEENLETKGMKIFKRYIFDEARMMIINFFVAALDHDRKEMKVERTLLKDISKIFMKMNQYAENSSIYQEFEKTIIECSSFYYRTVYDSSLSSWSCSEHVLKISKLYEEETQRLDDCLVSSSTIKAILVEFNMILIRDYKSILLEKGFYTMLTNAMVNDLKYVYKLYSKLEDNFQGVRQKFKDFVIETGMNKIIEKREELEKKKQEKKKFLNDCNDPSFVLKMIAFNDEFIHFIDDCFQKDHNFTIVYREALTSILNSEIGPFTFAEYLAKFSDKIMRKNLNKLKLQEKEVENYVEKIIQLFNNLNDKDLFIANYKNLFSDRLLLQEKEKIDFESEQLIISKIKISCGSHYTKELEGMLSDYNTSLDLTSQFKNYAKTYSSNVDFTIKVLCKANWPTEKSYSINLPQNLEFWKKEFDEYYKKNSSNYKILEWIYSLSTLTIRVNLKEKYEITMSMYQALLILLFENDQTKYTIKEIKEVLGLPEDLCVKIVSSMSEGCKLLEKIEENYQINKNFSSNLKRFSIITVNNKEKISKEKMIEPRESAIEAAIVRVMKSRKALKLGDLMEEVSKILIHFNATKELIKKKIDGLLAKDYLERDPKDFTVFIYKP